VKLGADDPYVRRGYGQERIEPGERPAVLVVDLQHLHTDHASPLAGAPLIDRAVESTARALHSLLTYARCDTVVVTGATTSGCVRATIVDAFSNNFRTIVPEDCVGDHEQGPHEANLRDVHRRYAEVTTSNEVLAYLAELAVPA
jgi:nicotinamidase-related amidase